MNSDDVIGGPEAAEIIGITPQTLWRWARTGKIPSHTMPNGRRAYSRSWAQEYVAQRERELYGEQS